jgi:hypothetical protein
VISSREVAESRSAPSRRALRSGIQDAWAKVICPSFALGGGKYLDLDVAAAGNTEVIRAKMRTIESLLLDDAIEDILITLGKQYHLIRLLKNSRDEQGLFLYLVLERQKANLALARHNLKRIENDLSV